jgi:hypothetical protein
VEEPIRPDGEEHLITLAPAPKALVAHGIVWDVVTGLRIPKFNLIDGTSELNPFTGRTNLHWNTSGNGGQDYVGGTYRLSFPTGAGGDLKNGGYVLKFTADGHMPLISRVIGPEEGEVELNVSLQPAAAVTVSVLNPDGRPATGTDIGLVFPQAGLALMQGGFSRGELQSGTVPGTNARSLPVVVMGRNQPGALLRTDAQGAFVLPPDDTVSRVVAASPAGYAEAAPAALLAHPVLQLQRWGSLTVNCVAHGQPVAGRLYGLEFGGGSPMDIRFDLSLSGLTTDARGQIIVTQLPPGHHNLNRLYPANGNGPGPAWLTGDKTPFEIRPGETTTLNAGSDYYTVTTTLQWPAGMAR